jgi:hypothetical protein
VRVAAIGDQIHQGLAESRALEFAVERHIQIAALGFAILALEGRLDIF